MTAASPHDGAAGGRHPWLAVALSVAAGLTASCALGVFLFGVIVTAGVYGSRIAWLLGVVLPLLAVTALLAWLASRATDDDGARRALRTVSLVVLSLFSLPFCIVILILGVYLVLFIRYEISHLL